MSIVEQMRSGAFEIQGDLLAVLPDVVSGHEILASGNFIEPKSCVLPQLVQMRASTD